MNRTKRVVVTGLGVVSSLGIGAKVFWHKLMSGASGLRTIEDVYSASVNTTFSDQFSFLHDARAKFRTKVIGSVTDLDRFSDLEKLSNSYGYKGHININKQQWPHIGLFSKFAVAASLEALMDSGVVGLDQDLNGMVDYNRIGVFLGNGFGGLDVVDKSVFEYSLLPKDSTSTTRLRKFGPYFIISCLPNLCSSYVSMAFGLRGSAFSENAACASSNLSIAHAADYIRSGRADIMVCGGSERATGISAISGFDVMSALTRSSDPAKASMPYNENRSGFVFADGAGIVVLEELEHAIRRQKHAEDNGYKAPTIYCEYIDHGITADAAHISSPSKEGVQRSMLDAIRYSEISADQITHVTGHGTSTPIGDKAELECIKAVLGPNDDKAQDITSDKRGYAPTSKYVVSAIKSSIGHTLAAAAGIQNVALCKSLQEGLAPPILNLTPETVIDKDIRFSLLGDQSSQKIAPGYAMSNSFGFGGVNVVSIWSTYLNSLENTSTK